MTGISTDGATTDQAVPGRSATVEELYQAARSGHRRSLGRLLTHVERGGPQAETVSELAHPDSGSAHILGITGPPGAGKSTLVGQLVANLAASGRRPAVLAVDPSSPLTGGAILGDRIRMDVLPSASPPSNGRPQAGLGSASGETPRSSHAGEPGGVDQTSVAFIRSMATRGHSGGLALAVPLAVRLFDAVGYDPVIIETVGVGQVEVDVVGAADTALVVVTPGMGDAVQANKAGLLEVADVFVVNKADRPGANDVRRDLDLMLDLSHMTGQEAVGGYRPPIVMSAAIDGTGAVDVLAAAQAHLDYLDETDQRSMRRRQRIITEVRARLEQRLSQHTDLLLDSEAGRAVITSAEAGETPPTIASAALLDALLGRDH
ncbi:MAG: methylmalonyl Co-A mutase-associated GTPase MeaB [Actinomycetota bacterium]